MKIPEVGSLLSLKIPTPEAVQMFLSSCRILKFFRLKLMIYAVYVQRIIEAVMLSSIAI